MKKKTEPSETQVFWDCCLDLAKDVILNSTKFGNSDKSTESKRIITDSNNVARP